MSYRTVLLAIALWVACAALAAGCAARAERLAERTRGLLAREDAQAAESINPADSQSVSLQLETYRQRRTLLQRERFWQRGSSALTMASALLALTAYGLFFVWVRTERPLLQPSRSALQVR